MIQSLLVFLFTNIHSKNSFMNVIITGASRGIGYALAKRFSIEKRIKLFIISRTTEKLQQLSEECQKINSRAEIQIISFDLTRLPSKSLHECLGKNHIDILINNAGALINKPFAELIEDDIMKMMNTNFLVPVKLIQQLFPQIGGKKPTHIVNIGSMGGFQGSVKFPGLSIYSATKAALASLTECLAVELADKNIYVNYLALGAVKTEMFDEAFPSYEAPVTASEMAEYITDFALKGFRFHNGKVIPVSTSTP